MSEVKSDLKLGMWPQHIGALVIGYIELTSVTSEAVGGQSTRLLWQGSVGYSYSFLM